MIKLQVIYKNININSLAEEIKTAIIPFDKKTVEYDNRLPFRDNLELLLEDIMYQGFLFLEEEKAVSILSIISISKYEEKEQPNNIIQNNQNQNSQTQNNQNHNKRRFKKRHFKHSSKNKQQENKPTQENTIVEIERIEKQQDSSENSNQGETNEG
jgi:hypothetical protein